MIDELRECPFCGGSATCDTIVCDYPQGGYVVLCTDEWCPGGFLPVANQGRPSEAAAIAAWNRRASGWVSVEERLPEPAIPVMVFVDGKRRDGTRFTRRLRAEYSNGRSHEPTEDIYGDTDWCAYDEEQDRYWCPEGWFESNEYEETHWVIDSPITHWQPLPDPPRTEQED